MQELQPSADGMHGYAYHLPTVLTPSAAYAPSSSQNDTVTLPSSQPHSIAALVFQHPDLHSHKLAHHLGALILLPRGRCVYTETYPNLWLRTNFRLP